MRSANLLKCIDHRYLPVKRFAVLRAAAKVRGPRDMEREELARNGWVVSPRPEPPVEDVHVDGRNPGPTDFAGWQAPFAAFEPFAPPPPVGRVGGTAPGRLAVITCYFNPCGYEALKRNYVRFADGMRSQGVPLYTIELAFNDAPFFLQPTDSIVRLRTTHVLWHKERLLNLLLERLPAHYDKVAWIDADLVFENSAWAEEAARRLEHVPVVQLFSEAHHLDLDGRRYQSRIGVACAVSTRLPWARDFSRVHPGFAWAARRELLARHGLFDRNVVGAGDTLMVLAMYHWWDDPFVDRHNEAMLQAFRNWGEPFYADVGGRVGFVEGSVLHLWHGCLGNRKYIERLDFLRNEKFDPDRDIATGPDGIWEWATDKPALHAAVRNYFDERQEDG
jgi:hypothetical protein